MLNDEKVEMLLEKKFYIIDILPQIASKNFFEVEQYYLNSEKLKEFNCKIENILLKLLCYYNYSVYYKDKWKNNITINELLQNIRNVIENKKDFLNILINENNTLIQLNNSDLYMTIYNPDKKLLEIITDLAKSEGLFIRENH